MRGSLSVLSRLGIVDLHQLPPRKRGKRGKRGTHCTHKCHPRNRPQQHPSTYAGEMRSEGEGRGEARIPERRVAGYDYHAEGKRHPADGPAVRCHPLSRMPDHRSKEPESVPQDAVHRPRRRDRSAPRKRGCAPASTGCRPAPRRAGSCERRDQNQPRAAGDAAQFKTEPTGRGASTTSGCNARTLPAFPRSLRQSRDVTAIARTAL